MPLVLSFAAKGLSVNVNDRNEEALKVLQSGRLPFIEIGANELLTKALAEKKLTFTSRPNEISTKGPVIVTIGTPVDEFLNPVRRVIQDCLDEIVPHLKDGQLIVLRSTIYPGTTEWIDDYFKRAGAVLTFFGFMHGETVGFAVTPSVALAYAMVAAFLFGLSRYPATAMAGVPAAAPAE